MKLRSRDALAALRYHRRSPAGKLTIELTKPCRTQRDLALAYTPGVAEPARQIAQRPTTVYDYTGKGNLVAVITNGTAVLGLGKVGPLAAKPVMEGKAVLFKRFAGIDAFDLEIQCTDPEQFIATVERLAPTFGGINLEDIAAPDCFYIETELQQRLSIPVFHDDQHGTAIISGAALLNALEVVGKTIAIVKIVMAGAGAAGIRCAEHYIRLGVQKKNITMCDSHGVITTQRKNLDEYKCRFAQHRDAINRVPMLVSTLADAMVDADVFIGVSVANIVTAAMVRSMASRPIVFALANPDPEIAYGLAKRSRRDILVATGQSNHPNQVNNVLGFPFVLRGALDVHARCITPGMKVAATKALAALAHEPVPTSVLRAYGVRRLQFGTEYIVPKPFDSRLLVQVSTAVAQAAMTDGVAAVNFSLRRYQQQLQRLCSKLQ